MAISSGLRRPRVYLQAGGQWLVEDGSCALNASGESSEFSCTIPMSLDGAEQSLKDHDGEASIMIGGETLLKGEIDEASFDYIKREIHVSGRDKSAKLHQTKINKAWQNKKPDEIIKEVAQMAGLSAEVRAQGKLKAGRTWDKDWVKLADNVSASSVIHKMCEMLGARWWVDSNGRLIVADEGQGSYSVNYSYANDLVRSDALSLVVRKNYQAAKNIKVKVKSWHQKQKKSFDGEKSVSGGGEDLTYDYSIGNLDQDHADEYAKQMAEQHAAGELEFNISCVGDTSCRPGMRLDLQGTAFAQALDIWNLTHHFGMSGHTMAIVARGAKRGRQAS